MKRHSLGYKPPSMPVMPSPMGETESGEGKEKMMYPSFTIQDIPSLLEDLGAGDMIEIVSKAKVVEITHREGSTSPWGPGDGCRVELELYDIGVMKRTVEEKEEEKGGEAFEKYMAKKG